MNFTCIIPFFNENKTLLSVVSSISKVKLINQIILIDDGSKNNLPQSTVKFFKNLTLIKLEKNLGKTNAVKIGLRSAKNENILLLDADYENLNTEEVKNALAKFTNSRIDMLLLKVKGGNNIFDRILRKETLFTGFRILKKQDLEKAFDFHPKGYQLEATINMFMIKNNKWVFWLPSNTRNTHKSKKWGIVKGYKKSFSMEFSILSFLKPINYLKQILYFGKNELK